MLRRRLGRFLEAAGSTDHETFEITLTVCEAAGNAIEHAYGPADETFDVEVEVRDGEVLATVRDRGTWRGGDERDDARVAVERIEPWGGAAARGRGIAIMEGLMDGVEVSAEDTGTVVRLRRRLGGSA
jgi:anti-sigma regulatory factor (Ser/Thr protein kinase)